jgi:hypothetical protein
LCFSVSLFPLIFFTFINFILVSKLYVNTSFQPYEFQFLFFFIFSSHYFISDFCLVSENKTVYQSPFLWPSYRDYCVVMLIFYSFSSVKEELCVRHVARFLLHSVLYLIEDCRVDPISEGLDLLLYQSKVQLLIHTHRWESWWVPL